MKKRYIGLLAFIVIFIAAFRSILGFSIFKIPDAIDVATSLGAKLTCSGYFVVGQTPSQLKKDLSSYSPITDLLTIDIDEERKVVTADMFSTARTQAIFREATGCTLEYGDSSELDGLVTTENNIEKDIDWPLGERVNTIDSQIQEATEKTLKQDNAAGLQTRALLVVKNGEILAESYGDNVEVSTPLLGWSMAKSVTAMLVGRMVQLGLADVSEVTRFAEWQNDSRGQIQIKDLLQMSSGIEFDETYAPGSDSTKMLFHSNSTREIAVHSPLKYSIGEHFQYSSGTSNLLASWIHEKLGGTQNTLSFFQKEFVEPLHLRDITFETDASGAFIGSSYVYATGRDWARLGWVMLNKGRFETMQFIPEEFVAAAQTPINANNDKKYGYQFWLNSAGDDIKWKNIPADAYMMMGNRKQIVMIIPSANVVIVRLGWTKGSYPTEANFSALLSLLKD